ncbi:hypothetical protein [Streptomyces sp. NPDC097619]|uniref:hypothetical protein n=1 Tax=Streptomyces sp. NPDC097619 TaxID=3157228 RepID=UPI00331E7C15
MSGIRCVLARWVAVCCALLLCLSAAGAGSAAASAAGPSRSLSGPAEPGGEGREGHKDPASSEPEQQRAAVRHGASAAGRLPRGADGARTRRPGGHPAVPAGGLPGVVRGGHGPVPESLRVLRCAVMRC